MFHYWLARSHIEQLNANSTELWCDLSELPVVALAYLAQEG